MVFVKKSTLLLLLARDWNFRTTSIVVACCGFNTSGKLRAIV